MRALDASHAGSRRVAVARPQKRGARCGAPARGSLRGRRAAALSRRRRPSAPSRAARASEQSDNDRGARVGRPQGTCIIDADTNALGELLTAWSVEIKPASHRAALGMAKWGVWKRAERGSAMHFA
eukprot:6202998-Pleurochrysis_carterae.AAC.2